ncbi:MAG TPA: glycerophosphodiester phosphodiesterase [Usitatibacter sp.]|nr:glycerophosphodiester phosphodiesterase [Usitatibacter sp.]
MPKRSLVAFLLVLAAGCASRFDLQGHRGARGLAPENTLAAFTVGLSIGVTTLEMDAAITKDDVVVVSHDPALNPDITRGPDGAWLEARGPRIRDLTFAELQRYDVGRIKPGTAYARSFPDQVAVDGTRFPRLADVFDLVRRSGADVQFDIETKVFPLAPEDTLPPDVFARRLIAEIRAAGMAGRTMIQSFDWRTLEVVRREAPEIRTVYLSIRRPSLDNICSGPAQGKPLATPAECAPSAWTAGRQLRDFGSIAKMVKAAGGHVWSPYHGDLDAAQRDEARALGLGVIPWTVNTPQDIAKVLDLKVDGIISDRPDRVREEMKRREMPLPRAYPAR